MTEERPSVVRRLVGRDFRINVLANLVANLIAAAIIYLLAVAGRYVTANPELVVLALSTLASAGLGLWVMRRLDRSHIVGRRGVPHQPGRARPAAGGHRPTGGRVGPEGWR
ncbi:hypothetical protein [Micromonospora echinospora]|uniref:hypothetical protein n=1 Tax=Micromonospora echinospora TaxID=1877 RepID=UPI00366E27A7